MLKKLVIVFFAVLIISALLTPVVYSLLSSISTTFQYPFSRVFDRVAMIVVVIGVFFYRSNLMGFVLNKASLVSICNPRILLPFLVGLIITLMASSLVIIILNIKGVFILRVFEFKLVLLKLLKIFPAAILIACIEEVFFRNIVLKEFILRQKILQGILITSILYSVCHFISPVYDFTYDNFNFLAGIYYLFQVCERFLYGEIYLGIFGLFLVGMVLGYTYWRTQSLAFCIGLHSGWIISLKLVFFLFALPLSYQFNLPLSRRYILASLPLTWISIVFVFLGVFAWVRSKKELYCARL